VEGSHARLKDDIKSSSGLAAAFKLMSAYYQRRELLVIHQDDKEVLGYDPLMSNVEKDRLVELVGKITHFALVFLKKELPHTMKTERDANCLCVCRRNYMIPCRHMLPTLGVVPIKMIARRWHLKPGETFVEYDEQPIEATSTQFENRDQLVSSVPNIIHDYNLSSLMNQLQDKINKMTNNQERITMASKIKLLIEDPVVDLRNLKPPPMQKVRKARAKLESEYAGQTSSFGATSDKIPLLSASTKRILSRFEVLDHEFSEAAKKKKKQENAEE
ncbi:hypothetical protein ABG067_007879, partial [Albugo candida]